MSQSVLTLCYGINLPIENFDFDENVDAGQLFKRLNEAAESGAIARKYDAYGAYPYKLFLGVELEQYIEGNNVNIGRLGRMLQEPDDELKEAYKACWDALDDEIRDTIVKTFGDSPRLFFLWSYS